MKKIKNKKTLIILLILCIGVIGITIAYFSNSTILDNLFSTKEYGTTYTETFISPDNWLPGDTTDKTVVVTNSGQVDEAVRISYTESWISNSGTTLSGLIDENGKLTDEEENSEKAAIINFSNTDDWTYDDGYYYYNYKLAPQESTSSFIESVTFNPKVTLGDICIETETATGRTVTCNSSGSDYDNATYKLTLTVETVQYNKYASAWGTDVAIAEEKPVSGVNYLLGNAKNTDGAEYNDTTKSKMFKMTHPATEQTLAQTEYRYIGDNPYNYVYFNCDDLNNQNNETCEVWRIIGVFDVDDGTGNYEQRIKLVRGSALPDTKQWDNRTSELYPDTNYGKNDWVGSRIQLYLNDNGDYYKRTGTAANYGLKENAKTLISDAKYYLGGAAYNKGYGTADAIYLWERGTKFFNYADYCLDEDASDGDDRCTIESYCETNSSNEICNVIRFTSWIGEVSLMYPSDYSLVYANGVDAKCYNNSNNCSNDPNSINSGMPETGWIFNSNKLEGQYNIYHNWFLSSNTAFSSSSFFVSNIGQVDTNFDSNYYAIRPVLYLSSNVKITEGTGEQNNPYKLGL